MFASFFPDSLLQLRESSAISLAQSTQRKAIATPFHPQPLATAYVHQGEGKTPIVLLHGFDSSLLEFRHLLPLLAEENETCALDLLGFGFTERIRELAYTPASIKTHLYCFWKAMIEQPVILVGASMGGAAAIDLTLTYPEVVQKLILIDSVGYSGGFPMGAFLFPPIDFLAVEWWRQRKLQALFWGKTTGSLDAASIEAIRISALHLEMPGWHEAITSFTKSGGYTHLAERIPQLDKQTLILWGEADKMLGTADAYKFKHAIADSELIWIQEAGHAPHIEQPHAVASEIMRFCSRS